VSPRALRVDRTFNPYPIFYRMLKDAHIVGPVPEFRFSDTRKWRFDLAWPVYRLALEIEGGIWSQGRHVRGKGFLKDCEKYNEAAVLGWRLLRVTPDQLLTRDTITLIQRAITPLHETP
jgi:hypothetical protein